MKLKPKERVSAIIEEIKQELHRILPLKAVLRQLSLSNVPEPPLCNNEGFQQAGITHLYITL
jgi:hypothetical protein